MRFLNLYIILFFISSLNIQAHDQISSTKVDVYDKYSSEIANPLFVAPSWKLARNEETEYGTVLMLQHSFILTFVMFQSM